MQRNQVKDEVPLLLKEKTDFIDVEYEETDLQQWTHELLEANIGQRIQAARRVSYVRLKTVSAQSAG